jgi:hypothetical protein
MTQRVRFRDIPVYRNYSPVGRRDNGRLKMDQVSKKVEMDVEWEGGKYEDKESKYEDEKEGK